MSSTMIGFIKKMFMLGCLVLALSGTSRVASACSVWYQDAYDDGTWVYSNTTTIQQTYGDSIRAYEQLTSPDSRFASQDTGDQITSQVVAWADLPINNVYGSYYAYGEAYENDIEEGSENQSETPCPKPTGETSTYLGTNNGNPAYTPSQPNVVGGLFSAALSGGSFPNRTVKETNVVVNDTCYYSNSFPQVTSPPQSGNTWTVNASNIYASFPSPDLIGADSSYVTYYQGQIRSGAAPYDSCSLTWTTAMSIDNCGAQGTTFYEQGGHTAGITITWNSVTAVRSAASGAAQ